jgi:outer membrane protein OmpA-like peptidoglycan-associated protein
MRIFILILGLLIYARLNSQLNFGEFNTPYSGVHGLSFNPAEVADSRYKFHANIIGVGLSASNNFIGVSSELKSSPIITPANQDQYFIRNLNGKPKNLYLQSDMMMPSAFMSFGRNNKLVFGFQTGIKALVTANNISERLANFLYDKNDTLRGWGPSSSKDFAANVSAWSYMGLTIGGVILDSRKITLKGAITGKLNQGIANMYMSSPDLYVSMSDGNVVRDANFTMKHQYASPLIDNNKFANSQLSIPGKHSGFGLDAGLIFEKKDKNDYSYEFDCRSDNYRKDKNKYAWRFGVSIIDYGSITWKPEGKTIRSYTIDSAAYAFPLNYKTFNKAAEPSSYIDSLRKYRFNGIDVDTTIEEYSMATPATLNAFVDLHIFKGFYLAMNGMYGFVTNNAASSKTLNTRFTFTPRLESKKIGIYLPIQYNMLAEETNFGLGARLLFMNFAISDLGAIAGLKSQTRNVGFNMSFNIPILNKSKPKDIDGDLMGRKTDKCPEGAGDCNTGGCPEPDDDGDGVVNSMDKCPKVKGPAKLDGCPDTDQDGVPDSKDRCPKVKGVYELGGCPDKDGDGIVDSEDKCPNEKGTLIMQGCPDSDGDGIQDNLDECPTIKGVYENKGCPKIEILDADKDGIEDKDDECPKQYGSKSNRGCPIVEKEAFDIAKIAQEKLEFHTGSSQIKPESLPSLTVFADYLYKNPTIKINLGGHTDNVGKPEKNMKLSIDRVNAVLQLFVTKGIDEARFVVAGYGDTKPIGDNTTISGRAVNRRVEIEIK